MTAKSVWCYLMVTDWKMKKSDWREFCKLRSLVKLARNELATKESMLMKSFGFVNNATDLLRMDKKPSCIKVYMYLNNCQSFNSNEISSSVDYCKDFTDGTDACIKLECPYVFRNQEYVIAKKKLNQAKAKCKQFLHDKLVREK